MRIALAADHAGFELKNWLLRALEGSGHTLVDKGTHSAEPVDYPDCAQAVGEALRQGEVDRAILICGSGVGASIAVNKMPGVRGGLCHDTYSAHQGVEHDDMNVLVLGARVIGLALAEELVRAFLSARFTGEERHMRRLSKVHALEARFSPGAGPLTSPER
ncbi:ribose 5-phosphate isomerase B [Stigmatella sp. ncwal1]|uniref:Ribose 5-phosphate isomerase B n=1 Tax=Stigmatella ashevillensis TaxID=2995309 RepID=A0ABT5DF27_9BACT|nr:ribose 5-phosphate isomerase B [Stigmatella ashevillena]MDC0712274.1 ribose 5-phosphate isomerase B [Stigmatella ashevillena]